MSPAVKLTLKVLFPIAIGLGVVAWMFHREFNPDVWHEIHFDTKVILCLVAACIFMVGRDFGMTWRFRALTDRQLRWSQCWRVDMMCEFTSCVTPTAVGGSALGMVYLHREGINLGRATALMMTTLFLDELFFVVSLPTLMLIIPYKEMFGFQDDAFTVGLQTVFWIVYGALFVWTAILFMGIFWRPEWVKRLVLWITHFRWFKKYRPKAEEFAQNMVTTGVQMRKRSWKWWGETFGGTCMTWASRYLVVNALFIAFAPWASQLIVFARQFVVWVVLMVSPTPGGSGVSEWLFTTYYGDLINSTSIALVIALFWRIITYYVYLVIGVCIVPGWINQGIKEKEAKKKQQTQS